MPLSLLSGFLLAVGVVGAPPQERSQPVTYVEATGPVRWRAETPSASWVQSALQSIDLSRYTLESVLHITESEVQAWRANGDLYSDFEGFLKLQLLRKPEATVAARFQKKNRMAAINIPTAHVALAGRVTFNPNLSSNGGNNFDRLTGNSRSNGNRLQYVSIVGNQSDNFASIPMQLNFSTTSDVIDIAIGTKFTIAGNQYTVVAVRDFKAADITDPIIKLEHPKLFSTVILKQLDDFPVVKLHGIAQAPAVQPNSPGIYWQIDAKGNFVRQEGEPGAVIINRPGTANRSLIQIGENQFERTLTLGTGVNRRSLKAFRLYLSATVNAWLDNIPLDPKQ